MALAQVRCDRKQNHWSLYGWWALLVIRETLQLPIPRVAGYPVDVVAESVAVNGERGTAEDYRIGLTQVRRAVRLWEEWKAKNRKG